MYAVNAMAFVNSPTTPQASVASMIAPSNTALGRLPATVVAGTVSYPELRNDSRNNPPYSQAAPETSPPPAEAARAQDISARNSPSITGFPTLFLAQLLSQNFDEGTQGLVVTYESLVSFADVKYKPSNATKPVPGNPQAEFFKALQ